MVLRKAFNLELGSLVSKEAFVKTTNLFNSMLEWLDISWWDNIERTTLSNGFAKLPCTLQRSIAKMGKRDHSKMCLAQAYNTHTNSYVVNIVRSDVAIRDFLDSHEDNRSMLRSTSF